MKSTVKSNEAIRANICFHSAIEMLRKKGYVVKSAHLTNPDDIMGEYRELPASFFSLANKRLKFNEMPRGFALCRIIDEDVTMFMRRYPDGLNHDELSSYIAESALNIMDWSYNVPRNNKRRANFQVYKQILQE